MAYLDMSGMEDMEATEIIDLAAARPSAVSPEIVDIADAARPIVPTEIVNLGQTAAQRRMAAPNLVLGRTLPKDRPRATTPKAAGMVRVLPPGTGINTPIGGGVLLQPLRVRRLGDGSFVAVGRAGMRMRGSVRPGQRISLVPVG